MKATKMKEFFKIAAVTLAAVGVFGALLLGANHLSLMAATHGEATLTPALEYVNIPENLAFAGYQSSDEYTGDTESIASPEYIYGITVIVTHGAVCPLALAPEEAASIGAQYILDIFGHRIDGMYVEMDFMDRGTINRSVWRGAVSVNNRYTLARQAYANKRVQEFMDAYAENPEIADMRRNDRGFVDLSVYFEYIPADFYFVIDAITGERIDVAHRAIQNGGRTADEMRAARQLAAERDLPRSILVANLSDQEIYELLQIAGYYGQRHFTNSTVVDIHFIAAHNNLGLDYYGNISLFPGNAHLKATDDTGRVASISICLEILQVTSISTMSNDLLPYSERHLAEGVEWGSAEY